MTQRYVYGVYSSYMDAETKADELTAKGVPHESISLVSKDALTSESRGLYQTLSADEAGDDRNWFQKLFGLDDGKEDLDFSAYEDSLNNNQVLLVIDSEYERLISDYEVNRANEDLAAPLADETTYPAAHNVDRAAPLPPEDEDRRL